MVPIQLLRLLQPAFPALTVANFRVTSPVDPRYNCIAWAAGDQSRWWWPDPQSQSYWPLEAPREVTLGAFIQAYGLLGYTETCSAAHEAGKQKVAIYTFASGTPTHASRQVPDGWWASKLGEEIDIEHELGALNGPVYGRPAVILARSSP